MTTPRSEPGPGARALYLGRKEHKRVACTAEALVVSNARGQTLRYPLNRVARVVCSVESTDWTGSALALCMRAGIGIAWTDARGAPLGTAYPASTKSRSFSNLLELMLEDPTGLAHYGDWFKSRRMRVLMQWARHSDQPVAPVDWEALKRDWVYRNIYAARLTVRLHGHCMAHVSAQLGAHGLPPLLIGPQAQTLRLDHDLSQLLWVQMNLETTLVVDDSLGDREITTLFESWITRNGATLLLHLNSLQRCARRVNCT